MSLLSASLFASMPARRSDDDDNRVISASQQSHVYYGVSATLRTTPNKTFSLGYPLHSFECTAATGLCPLGACNHWGQSRQH